MKTYDDSPPQTPNALPGLTSGIAGRAAGSDRDRHLPMRIAKFISLVATLVMVGGGMVLIGWAFDIAALKSILPGWVSMKPNAAVAFILTGIAVLLSPRTPATFNPQAPIFFSGLARLCGLLAGLIGLLTLSEYIFGWDLGIDHWLFRELTGTVGTSHPGRMAPETALCFTLLAAALLISSASRKTRLAVLASVSIGVLVATFALAALLSYFTSGLGAYGWFGLTIMAVHTAMLFVMLGLAVIAINWQSAVLSWSLSRNITAVFAGGLALLVFVGLNTSRSQLWMNETSNKIADAEQMQGDTESLQAEVTDAHVHARDYLVTGDERFLKAYLLAKAGSNTKLDELNRVELGTTEPMHHQHSARIDAQVKAQFQWLQQMIGASRAGMTDAVRNNMISHADNLLNDLHTTLGQAKNDDRQLSRQLKQELENVSWFVYLTIFTGTFASLLIFLGVIFRLNFAVNERKQAEEQIRNLAFYDTLTQLPNRRLLDDRMAQAIASSKRSSRYVTLMFLDLDNFKPLNDMYGHHAGDLLLIEVARRITSCVREMDTVARFGGDEFVVMLGELDTDKAESTAQAGNVAEKIRAILAEPYVLKLQQADNTETAIEHHCAASIGVVVFNSEASPENVLKWADMAMYQSKELGRNRVHFYGS